MEMKPGVKCGTLRYRKVMGVWGSWSSPSHVKMNSLLCLTANFPVSCPCVHGLTIPSHILHSAKEVLCTTGCWDSSPELAFTLTGTSLLQRSHKGAINIQVRTGWAAREMKPLDADVFTAGVSFHSHFNPGWQTWFIYETGAHHKRVTENLF